MQPFGHAYEAPVGCADRGLLLFKALRSAKLGR
jgi:hypothetical protein